MSAAASWLRTRRCLAPVLRGQARATRAVVGPGVRAARRGSSVASAPRQQAHAYAQAGGWAALGLAEDVCEAGEQAGALEPTAVQKAAAPGIVARRDAVIASHTGSGASGGRGRGAPRGPARQRATWHWHACGAEGANAARLHAACLACVCQRGVCVFNRGVRARVGASELG